MSPSDLSSLEWEADGEMSAQDTWDLVNRLAKVEEQEKASSLLQLSSKHIHSKDKKSQLCISILNIVRVSWLFRKTTI